MQWIIDAFMQACMPAGRVRRSDTLMHWCTAALTEPRADALEMQCRHADVH